ncbi:transposase family protein [Salininema proteolyticum]|uniref:Transposase family protein n=1 Tax=Salininema proteolyticum TaxID=1607685 RepID=A0ABV8U444_9ACTN
MHYRASINLSEASLQLTARLIRKRRAAIGTHWRKLGPAGQAKLALVYLVKHDTLAELASGFGVGIATAWRYIREVLDLLAALAPSLEAALWTACSRGLRTILLDGTCCETDRLHDYRDPDIPWREQVDRHWCAKHKHHSVTLQGITDLDGNLLWLGTAYPGSVHDLTAARADGVFTLARKVDLEIFADKGYIGAGPGVTTPIRGRNLPEAKLRHNYVVNSIRALVERGFAQLKKWAIFNRSRCSPQKVGQAAHAWIALTIHEGQI